MPLFRWVLWEEYKNSKNGDRGEDGGREQGAVWRAHRCGDPISDKPRVDGARPHPDFPLAAIPFLSSLSRASFKPTLSLSMLAWLCIYMNTLRTNNSLY